MANGLIFRIIPGILFVLVIGTRRVYERRSDGVAQEGLKRDLDRRMLFEEFGETYARYQQQTGRFLPKL